MVKEQREARRKKCPRSPKTQKSEKFSKRRGSWQGDGPVESRLPGVWSRHTVTNVDGQGLKHVSTVTTGDTARHKPDTDPAQKPPDHQPVLHSVCRLVRSCHSEWGNTLVKAGLYWWTERAGCGRQNVDIPAAARTGRPTTQEAFQKSVCRRNVPCSLSNLGAGPCLNYPTPRPM
jgi:hypothetical protein